MSNYICKLDETVERTHVRYSNRYGMVLAGDLYTRKGMDETGKYAAIVVGRALRRREGAGARRLCQRAGQSGALWC